VSAPRLCLHLALALPLLVPLVGCGYTETHEVPLRTATGPTARPAEIYMADQRAPRPFFEVALLQVLGHGTDANVEDVAKALQVRAAQLGCDAVVRVRIDQGYTTAHGFGVCIRYPPAGQSALPASPVPASTLPAAPVPAPAAPPPSGDVAL
jgi:hypothetical protein